MKTSEVESKLLVHASLEFRNLNKSQFTSILGTIVRCHPHYLTSYSFPKGYDTVCDITLDVAVDSTFDASEVRNTLNQLNRTYSPMLLSSYIGVSDNTIKGD